MTVHVYEPTDTVKPCFGHLALMYSKPRSASVFAKTNGSLWELDRPVFQYVMLKKSRREVGLDATLVSSPISFLVAILR